MATVGNIQIDVPVRRGDRGLGIVVSPNNIILSLAPGGSAEEDKKLLVGDAVLGVDGILLKDSVGDLQPLKDLLPDLPKKPSHMFSIQRSRSRLNNMRDQVNARIDAGAGPPRSLATPPTELGDMVPTYARAAVSPAMAMPASASARRVCGDDDDEKTVIASTPSPFAPRTAVSPATQVAASNARPPIAMPTSANGASNGASNGEIVMVLLAPDGCRFKQHIMPPYQLGSSAATIDMAMEAWVAASQRQPLGPLRVEAVKYDGDRVILTRASPLTALRSIAELRVSAAAIEGQEFETPTAPPTSLLPAMDEKRWVAEATRAANAAIERTAVEATATSNVLQDLMTQLGDVAAGTSAEIAAKEAAATTTEKAMAVANSMAAPTADVTAIGEDVLPPALLEKMRPRLAIALQQAAALAVKATEQRSESALKAALQAAEDRHKSQIESLMHSAATSAEKERNEAVDKVMAVSHEQSHEHIAKAVAAARLEEAKRFQLEKAQAVREAVEAEQRKAETAKKNAIEHAIAATEKHQEALRERACKEAEERTSMQWRNAMKQSERGNEEKMEAALQRAATMENEAAASQSSTELRLRDTRNEVQTLKHKLEEAEAKRLHVERSVERRVREEVAKVEAEQKKREDAAVMTALKSYERRAADEKNAALKAAVDEAKTEAAKERMIAVEALERAKAKNSELIEGERKRGFSDGHAAAMSEMAAAEQKAATAARAESNARMQERAQADVQIALALAGVKTALPTSKDVSVAASQDLAAAVAAENKGAAALSPKVMSGGGSAAVESSVSKLPGVMEAVRAAEEKAKASAESSARATIEAAKRKFTERPYFE